MMIICKRLTPALLGGQGSAGEWSEMKCAFSTKSTNACPALDLRQSGSKSQILLQSNYWPTPFLTMITASRSGWPLTLQIQQDKCKLFTLKSYHLLNVILCRWLNNICCKACQCISVDLSGSSRNLADLSVSQDILVHLSSYITRSLKVDSDQSQACLVHSQSYMLDKWDLDGWDGYHRSQVFRASERVLFTIHFTVVMVATFITYIEIFLMRQFREKSSF